MNPDPVEQLDCIKHMNAMRLKIAALEARVNVLAGTNIAVIGALVAFAVA
jgi:hypothetical protein